MTGRWLAGAALALLALAAQAGPRSGYDFASPELRALQDDAFANPGMLWLEQGAALWRTAEGAAGRACAGCHGDGAGLAEGIARYPAWDAGLGRPISLWERVNLCRARHMQAAPLAPESEPLMALTLHIRRLAAGRPMAVEVDGPMRPFFERGRALYATRRGQFNLACTQCHDERPGEFVRGEKLSEGQINGFPAYLQRWSAVGSAHRRFQVCDEQARAEPLPIGDPDYLALEVYVAHRGRGLPIEVPAVRR